MRIAEIFRSRQGEGRLTGTESLFVRASGCNLRCAFCDTPYASWEPEGPDLAVDDVVARVEELAAAGDGRAAAVRHAVLTGGEPMLSAELIPLSEELRRRGYHLTVETAGTLYLPVACDLMSISPKLSNSTPGGKGGGKGDGSNLPARPEGCFAQIGPVPFSWTRRHDRGRLAPEVLRRLVGKYDYQVKLVIDRPEDRAEIERFLATFPEIDRAKTMLMPQGTQAAELTEKAQWVEPLCEELGVEFCPRRQIEWYGYRRGT